MPIDDSTKSMVKCYYLQNGTSKDVKIYNEPGFYDEEGLGGKGIIIFDYEFYSLVTKDKISDYVLKFPDNTSINLYLKIDSVDVCQAKLEKCYCKFPIREVKYNGNSAEENWFGLDPVFTF